MAKKDNFKKAKVSKVKMPSTGAWLTKAGKSVGLAAFDVLKEMMPATADTVASASEAMSDLRDEISGMGSGSDNMIAQKLYSGKESITKATKSILADLKEGNLYKSPGSDMDDFDMSDFDIGDDSDYDTSFESEDGSTKVTTSKAKPDGRNDVTNVNVKVNIGDDSPMVEAVRNQTKVASDSAKAQLEYTKLNDTNMMKSFSSLKTMLRGNLGSIDSNISSVATGITTIAQATSVSLKYYDDSMQMMTSINQNLTAIKEYMTQPKTMAGYAYGNEPNVLDLFTANGGLDIGAYMKTVKNQASTAIDNNIILSTIKSIFDSRDMLSSMNPLSMATEAVMKKMIPGLVKQAAETFDRTLSESAISFLYRLRGMGNNSDNPLLQFLGETFGIDNRYKDRIDKSNYNRGKVDWNGQSHKTLNEVIPYYLRQISSALSGKEEKVFDYERGVFRDLQDVITEYKEMDKSITLDGFSGVLDDFKNYMDNINVQFSNTNMEEAVNKSMERFLTTLVKNNSGGMMQLKDTGDGTMSFLDSISKVLGTSTDDDAAKLIASFFDSNDRSYTMSAFGRKILEARANATNRRNAIEANQTASNSMYIDNGVDAPGKRLNYKKSPFVETDSYGKTPIFYMKNIYKLLAEGIRVFPETSMFGGTSKPRYYDKVLNEFNNLQTTKKSREAAENAKSARAMTRQEEEYVKQSGGFVVGNGNEVSLKSLTAAGKDYQKQLKNEELDEKSRSSLFNKLTGLGSDTVLSKIVNKTVEAVNKPSKLLAGVFDYLDNQLFNIVFGGKTGPRGSIVNSAMNFMKDKFAQFSTWLNDKVLTPVYESIFGEEGLINQIKESEFGQSVKEGWQKFKESLFGKEDENGNLVGGMFSEFGNDVKKIGKDLYDRVLGDNPDSFWSGTKRQFANMFSGISSALGYDLEEARKRREKTGKGPVTQMLDDLRVTVKGRFKAWTDALVGEEADPKALTTQLARGLQADMKGMNTSKIGSSAMFGAITSLFLPGGPILHMFLGAGKSFVKQSETLQTLLFGERDENGERKGRFISKELINLFEENKTGIKIGLGAGVLSTIGILPGIAGGSLMYAVAGGAASFVYNMDSVQEMLFGPKDENGERVGGGFVDRFKKAIGGTKQVKTTGIDAGVGAGIGIVGSLFLPGGPLLWGLSGSILGIAASTDKFKDYMFGAIDKESGKRKGGMLPKMYEQMMGPVKNAIYATQIKAVSWLEERVITPMASAISPMLAQVNYLIEDVRKGIANTVKFVQGKLMDFVLKPAGKATRTIFAPFIKATKIMFKGLLKIVGRVLTSPFNMMKNVGYGLNALHRRRGSKDFKNNTIKNALTFNKEKREKLGLTKEQGKLGNRVKSFAKYYSRKARKDAKFGEKGAWYNKDGMTSRQEQKQRVKESRAWRDYRLKEYKKDKEKRFTNEDRLAFDKKYGYMQWWKKNDAKPKVKPVDTKKKLAEIQSDKSTVNTKNVILNYTGTLKKKGAEDAAKVVPSTGVYMLSKGQKVIPNKNVAESIKKENALLNDIKGKKATGGLITQTGAYILSKGEKVIPAVKTGLNKMRAAEEVAYQNIKSGATAAYGKAASVGQTAVSTLQAKAQQVLATGNKYFLDAKGRVLDAAEVVKGNMVSAYSKAKAAGGKALEQAKSVGTDVLSSLQAKAQSALQQGQAFITDAKGHVMDAAEVVKGNLTSAYSKAKSVGADVLAKAKNVGNQALSAGKDALSTLQAQAQTALQKGQTFITDAKGRVLDATEVVKGNLSNAYASAKAAGEKAISQAKVYGNQALSAGKDALASLQAKAQSALQKGQTVITDAKGHVMDAAEVVKGNLTSAYSKAKSMGADALAKAKNIGSNAWNTAQKYGNQALSKAKELGSQALTTGKEYANIAANKIGNVASQAKTMGTNAWSTAQKYGSQAWNTAKQYGSNALNTAQQYGSQALSAAQKYGSQALSAGKQYAGQIAGHVGNLATKAQGLGTQALTAAKGIGSQALSAGQAGLSSLASSASALPGMLSTALSGVSLPTVGLAAGGLLAAGAVGLGAKKLYDRHKRKKALQASSITGRMADGGTVRRDGTYILSEGEQVVPVQQNGVARVVINLKDSIAAAKAGRDANIDNTALNKVTQQQAAFMKQQVDQMGQMLDLQRIIRSDIDAEKAYKIEQRNAKKARKGKLRKTSAKAKLKQAEQLRKAQEKGRYQTLKRLQDEQKEKEKLYKAIFDIKDNTYEMIDKQEKTRIDWKEVFGKKKGLLLLSLLAVVPAILNVVRNYKSIFAKIGQYTSSLSGRVSRSVEMMGGISGMISRIGDTFSRMVEWFKDPEARKQTFEDFMDNAKNNKEQLKTYAQEAYHKARYGTYKTMEGIKQNTLGGSDTDAYGSKVGNKAKKVGKRAIQRLVTYANTTIRGKRRGKEFMKGVDAYTGADFKRGFTKVKDGIRSGVDNVKGFADDVTGRTAINAQDLINREANKIRTVDVNGKIGSYQYYLNDWKANGQKYLANGDTKLTKEQFQKLYESKASKEIAANADNAFENALDRAYRKYAKQAGANAMSLDEFLAKNAEEFATKMKSRTTGSLDDVIKNMANETTKTKVGKFANKTKDITSKVNTKLNLKQRLANTVDNIKGTKPGDIVDGVKNKFATIKDRVRPKAVGADDVMLNARDAVAKKQAKVGVKQRLTGAKNNIKNAAGKVGSSMKGFADDVAQNGVKQAGKNAASDMVGKVRSAGTKVAGKVKNIVGEDAAKKAAGYIDDMFKWLGGAIKKVAGKFGASSADNIISKIVTKFSKLLKAGKVFKEFAQRLSKTLVKGAAKLATGLNVIMGVGGGIFGAFDAANLFAVDKSAVDVKMRAISALWGSLKNLSIIASVVDLANEILYSVMGISFIREISVMLYTFLSTPEESDNLDQAMKDFEDEYNNAVSKEYQEFLQSDEGKKSLVTTKDENGNTIQRQMTLEEFKKSGKATTFQEYNNAKHKTVGTKIKTAVSGVKDKIVGAASAFAGWKDRKWSELGSGYFNVDEMNEDGTMKSQLEIMKERGKKILLYPFEIVKTAIGSVMKVIDPFIKIVGGVIKGIGGSLTSGMKEMFTGGITHIASPDYWKNPNPVEDEAGAISNIGFYAGRFATLIPAVIAGVAGSVWNVLKGVINNVKKLGAALAEDSMTGFGSITSIKDVFSGKYWSMPSEQESEFSALRKIVFYANRVALCIPSAIIGLTKDVLGVIDPIISPIRKAISGITDKIDLDDNGISDLKEDSVGGMNKIIYYTSKFFTIGASIFRGILKKVNEVVGPVINSLKNAVGAIPQVLQESVGRNPIDGDYWAYKAPDNGDGGMLHRITFYTTKVLAMPITLVVNVVKAIGKKIGGVIGNIVDTAKAIGGDIGDGIKYAQTGESMFNNKFWTLTDETGEGIGPLRKILFVVGRLGIFAVMSVINVVKKVKDNIGPIMDTVKKVGGLIASDFKGAWTTTLESGQGAFGNAYWTIKNDSDEGLGPLRKVLFYGSRTLAFIPMAVVTIVHKVYLAIKPIIDSVKSAIKGVQDALSDNGEPKDGDIRNDKSKAPTPKKDKFSFNALSTIAFYGKKVFTVIFNTVSTVVKVAYTVLKPIISTIVKVTGFIIEDLTTGISIAATKGTISKEYWTMNSSEKETGGFAVLRPIMFYTFRILSFGPMTAIWVVTSVLKHLKPIIDTAKMLGTALKNDFMSGFETAIKNPLGTLSPEYWTFKGEESTEGLGVVRPIMFYTGRVLMFPILSMYSVLATIVRTVASVFRVVSGIGESIAEDAATGIRDVVKEPAGTLSKAYWTMDEKESSNNGLGPVRTILFYTGRVLMFPPLTVFTVVKTVFNGIKKIIDGVKTVAGYIKEDGTSGIKTVLRNDLGTFSADYWKMTGKTSDEGFGPLRKILFYSGRMSMFPVLSVVTVVKAIFKGIKKFFDGVIQVAKYIQEDANNAVSIASTVGTFSGEYWSMDGTDSEEGFGTLRKILFYTGRVVMFPILSIGNVVKKIFEGIGNIFNGIKTVSVTIANDVINAATNMDATDIFTSKYWTPSDIDDAGSGFNVLYKIAFYTTRVLSMPTMIVKSVIDTVSNIISGFIKGIKDIGNAVTKAVDTDGTTFDTFFDPSKAGLAAKTGIGGILQSVIFYGIRAFLFPGKALHVMLDTVYDILPDWMKTGVQGFKEMTNIENWTDGTMLDAIQMWAADTFGFGGNGGDVSGRRVIGGYGDGPDSQNGFAYYSQNDPSIKNSPYTLSNGGQSNRPETMGSRGCGPTAMAMVASSVKGGYGYGENPYSPTNMARIAEKGNYSTNIGTTPAYFTQVGQQLGMNVTPSQPNGQVLQNMLGSGEPVIMQGRSDDSSSPYTKGGHYVVAVGMNPDGTVNVNDPRGKKYSKSYTMNQMLDGSGMMWGYSDADDGTINNVKGKKPGKRRRTRVGGYGPYDYNKSKDGYTRLYRYTVTPEALNELAKFIDKYDIQKKDPKGYEAINNIINLSRVNRNKSLELSQEQYSKFVKALGDTKIMNTPDNGLQKVADNVNSIITKINKASNYDPSKTNSRTNGTYNTTQEKINSYIRSFNAYKTSYYQANNPADRDAIVEKMTTVKNELKKFESTINGSERAYIKRDQYKSLTIPKALNSQFDNLGYQSFNGKTSGARQADYDKKLKLLKSNMTVLQTQFYQAHDSKTKDTLTKRMASTTKKILNLNKKYGIMTDSQYSEYADNLVKLKKKFAKEKDPVKRAQIKDEIYNLSNKLQGQTTSIMNNRTGSSSNSTVDVLKNNIAIWTNQYYQAHDIATKNDLSAKIAEAKKQLAALYGVDASKVNVNVPKKIKGSDVSASDVTVEGVNEAALVDSGSGVAGSVGDGSWLRAIKAVKAAIAAQKPGYSQSNFIKINIDGVEYSVRTDCSGFVSACLKVIGKMNAGTNLSSQNFRNKSDSTMMGTGFTPMDWPGWEGLQEGDIIAKSGHVEIFAYNEGTKHRVYNCGSDDSVNNPEATPSSKPGYETVWRPSADISGSAGGASSTIANNSNNGNGSLSAKLAALAAAFTTPIKEYLYGSSGSSTNGTTSTGSGGSSVANVSITGGSTPEKVWNYFTGKGYSPAATAGILGNMQQESGVDPAKVQSGSGHAAGIVQWESYKNKSGRWKDMADFATRRGYDWTALEPQLMFVDEELQNLSSAYWSGGSKGMKDAGASSTNFASWKQSTDVEMATRQFEGSFERAGIPRMENRISAAKQYYDKFSGGNGGFGGFGGFGDSSSRVSKNYSTSNGKAKPSAIYGGFGGSTKPSRMYGAGSSTSKPSGMYGGFGAGDVSDITNVADTSYMVNSDYIEPDKLPVQTKPNNTNKPKTTGYRNSGGYGKSISTGIDNYNKKQSKMNKTDTDTMVNILTEMLAELKGTNVGINKFNDKDFTVNSPVYVSDTTNNNVVTKQDGQTNKKSETIKKKSSFIDKDSYSIAKKIASGRSYA